MKDKSKRLTVVNTEKKPSEKKEVQQVIVQPSSSSSSHAPGFNPNLYLLKSVWDSVFEIKTDVSGQKYIFGKLPVVTKYGITMYADDGNVEIPQLAEGLPYDQRTIWFNPETKQIEVIGGTGGGVADSVLWDNVEGKPSWITNTKPKYSYSEIEGTPDLSGYATTSSLNAVSTKLNDFLEGSDTDTVINKWKELETFLSGLSESDNLATILTGKADKSYVDTNFVTIAGTEDVTGLHNFVNGLEIGGLPITKKQDDVVYLDANLVVRGGITMYGDGEGGSSVPSYSTLGSLLNVDESNDAVASVDRVLFQSAGSNVWSWKALSEIGGGSGGGSVSGDYLPLIGGTISGTSTYPLVVNTTDAQSGIQFLSNNDLLGVIINGGDYGTALINFKGKYRALGIDNDGNAYTTIDYSNTKANLLHTYNYSSYALPLSGGTLTASVAPQLKIVNNGNTDAYITMTGSNGYSAHAGMVKLPTTGDAASFGYSERIVFPVTGGMYYCNGYNGDNQVILHAGNYSSYALPLSGGQMIGHIYMTGAKADSSTANTTQIVFGTPSDNHVCITSNRYGIIINRSLSDTSNQIALYADADSESFIQSHLRISGNLFSNIFFSHGGSVAKQSDASMYTWDNHLQINKRAGMTYIKTLLSFDLVNETATFNLNSQLRFNSNMFWVSDSTNPHMALVQGGHNWYVQVTQGQMFFGAGATNSLRIDASGNILTPGGITMYSDQRKKTILNHVELSLKQIADAPLIEHYYNSDQEKTTHVGSIAQYWAELNDWFCKLDNEGFYTMEIQNCALASAISIARHLEKYESKTDKTIRKMKKRIQELEDEVERLKQN